MGEDKKRNENSRIPEYSRPQYTSAYFGYRRTRNSPRGMDSDLANYTCPAICDFDLIFCLRLADTSCSFPILLHMYIR